MGLVLCEGSLARPGTGRHSCGFCRILFRAVEPAVATASPAMLTRACGGRAACSVQILRKPKDMDPRLECQVYPSHGLFIL